MKLRINGIFFKEFIHKRTYLYTTKYRFQMFIHLNFFLSLLPFKINRKIKKYFYNFIQKKNAKEIDI